MNRCIKSALVIAVVSLTSWPRLCRSQEVEEIATFKAHPGRYVMSLVFSPDGRMLVSNSPDGTSPDGTIKLWEIATAKERASLTGHPFPQGGSGATTSLAFSPDGKTFASTGLDDTVKIWQVFHSKERAILQTKRGCTSVGSVNFSPDGATLAAYASDRVLLWETCTGKSIGTFMAHTLSVDFVGFSPNGKTLVTSGTDAFPEYLHGKPSIKLWDRATGKNTAVIWDASHPQLLTFSPGGKNLAAACDGKNKLKELPSGKDSIVFKGSEESLVALAFSPDGKTLTGASKDETIRRWEVSTGKNIWTIHKRRLKSAAVSPDGKTLAAGDALGMITLWHLTAASNERTDRQSGLDGPPLPNRSSIPSREESTTVLSDKELTLLWDELAGTDAAKAYQAMGRLVACPKSTVSFFKTQLRPTTALDPKQVAQLIANMDNDEFTLREKASAALAKLGEMVAPFLQRELAKKPTPEVRCRIEELLRSLEQLSAESLRFVRAVETLEYIGDGDARQLLATLAQGAAASRLTKEAQATSIRLGRRESMMSDGRN